MFFLGLGSLELALRGLEAGLCSLNLRLGGEILPL